MSQLRAKFGKISVFSIIITLFLSGVAFSEDKADNSDCYKQIDTLLKYDDNIKVTDNDGQTFLGEFKKLGKDNIKIRYKPIKFIQSPVIQLIKLDDISKIELEGIREKRTFLPKQYTRLLFFSAGVLYSSTREYSSYDEARNIEKSILYVGFAMLFGELVNHITITKIPIDLTIQCR